MAEETVKKEEVVKKVRKKLIARVKCNGDLCNMKEKVMIEGIEDCKAASELETEGKECTYGCLGYGSCAKVCPFGAIDMINGLAVVNKEKCKGCRLCVKACPKDIIDMIPEEQEVVVDCSSKDIGKDVRAKCTVGCIGCKMCERACPVGAIIFEDNLADIDYEKCINCKVCAKKCPTKAITTKFPEVEMVAKVLCKGSFTNMVNKQPMDESIIGCAQAAQFADPETSCMDGCLGYGSCEKACPFDAIQMLDGVAVVDKDKCEACEICVGECPRNIIEMIPKHQDVIVECSSKLRGKPVKDICKVGCIGCTLCVKECEFFAMNFDNNLATVFYENCTNCTLCAQKCPTKAIGANTEGKVKVVAQIDPDKCIGCTVCWTSCPVFAVEGYREEPHWVKLDECIGCQYCAKRCPEEAIRMTVRA